MSTSSSSTSASFITSPPNSSSTDYIFYSISYLSETDHLPNMENIQEQPALALRDSEDEYTTGDWVLLGFAWFLVGVTVVAFVGFLIWVVFECTVLILPPFPRYCMKSLTNIFKETTQEEQGEKEKRDTSTGLGGVSARGSGRGSGGSSQIPNIGTPGLIAMAMLVAGCWYLLVYPNRARMK